MTQDEAERLAREYLRGYGSNETACQLCDHILSGDHKREIENAAFERAAKTAEKLGYNNGSKIPAAIRALIQPPAQKDEAK